MCDVFTQQSIVQFVVTERVITFVWLLVCLFVCSSGVCDNIHVRLRDFPCNLLLLHWHNHDKGGGGETSLEG